MTTLNDHARRVRRELRAAGVRPVGFLRFGIRYLPSIIHSNEHVHGIVYGRYRESSGHPAWEEGTLIATDRRVIFLDRKPGYLRADDITYDVVSGVEASRAWVFSAVMLFTKIGNFSLRFTRPDCARIFVRYVEKRRVETLEAQALNRQPEASP